MAIGVGSGLAAFERIREEADKISAPPYEVEIICSFSGYSPERIGRRRSERPIGKIRSVASSIS